MNSKPILVLITAPSKDIANQIANALVEQKLAACVNLVSPVNSLYTWEGETYDDKETLLIVKTRAELFEDHLIPVVQAIHPDRVPEIIAIPILMGLQSYLEWIEEETTK